MLATACHVGYRIGLYPLRVSSDGDDIEGHEFQAYQGK